MSMGRRLLSAPGHQGDAESVTERIFGSPGVPEMPMDWTWNRPPNSTASSDNSELEHRSGLVPGLIAASIFIMFLLCLYTILWRCMVSQAHRNAKRYRKSKKRIPTPIPQKPILPV
ncbi:uncharacterized protein O3C94_010043 isoform 2-T3 [Discoglossus pictus]